MKRRLGQHLLVDPKTKNTILDSVQCQGDEVVFEIGAGTGELTENLCKLAKKVIATEIDPQFYRLASQRLSHINNLQLMNIDGFKFDGHFDLLVSNLPYSESSHFIEWLASKTFRRAVVTVQREFAQKLIAEAGAKNYRAISALAQAVFQLKAVTNFGRSAFRPRPQVNSTLMIIERRLRTHISREIQTALKKLFGFRGRMLSSALRALSKQEGEHGPAACLLEELSRDLLSKRIEHLEPSEALIVASALGKSNERGQSVLGV